MIKLENKTIRSCLQIIGWYFGFTLKILGEGVISLTENVFFYKILKNIN